MPDDPRSLAGSFVRDSFSRVDPSVATYYLVTFYKVHSWIGSASRCRCRYGGVIIWSGVTRRSDSMLETWKVASSARRDLLTQISLDCWALILVRAPVCHHPFFKLTLAPLSSRCKQELWRYTCDFSTPCTWSVLTMTTQVWTLVSKRLMYPLVSFADVSQMKIRILLRVGIASDDQI